MLRRIGLGVFQVVPCANDAILSDVYVSAPYDGAIVGNIVVISALAKLRKRPAQVAQRQRLAARVAPRQDAPRLFRRSLVLFYKVRAVAGREKVRAVAGREAKIQKVRQLVVDRAFHLEHRVAVEFELGRQTAREVKGGERGGVAEVERDVARDARLFVGVVRTRTRDRKVDAHEADVLLAAAVAAPRRPATGGRFRAAAVLHG
mmetsp:Transcript_18296/g.63045  ORF Transcript_18296/g.63045 Transcript_18296/m.63045 type:complete len:204 (+) Transcript_18296:1557-2168(+)